MSNMSLIPRISSMARSTEPEISPTLAPMDSEAALVSAASSWTFFATMANPLPCSPALAASMEAFRARRLVCLAIRCISFDIFSISRKDSRVPVVASTVLDTFSLMPSRSVPER